MGAQAANKLNETMALKHDAGNVVKIREALARATKAGVKDCDAPWVGLLAETEEALVVATTAANASWNAQTITGLADAIHLGEELNLPHGTDTDKIRIARTVFEKQLENSFQGHDVNKT